MMKTITETDIWKALEDVKDPEIPVVSLVEMGIIREVALSEGEVVVTMTPTFSGCPALQVMETDIIARLQTMGLDNVSVKKSLSPPWSSDWITAEARQKLKQFGLAPPPKHGGQLEIILFETITTCPYCDSQDTVQKNAFGPTLCRAIHYCNSCQQPFEQFKPL